MQMELLGAVLDTLHATHSAQKGANRVIPLAEGSVAKTSFFLKAAEELREFPLPAKTQKFWREHRAINNVEEDTEWLVLKELSSL